MPPSENNSYYFTISKWNSLAEVHRKRQLWSTAIELYKHVLSLQEKELGSEHLDVAVTLHKIAEIYSEASDYKTARNYYDRAVSIWERANPPENYSLLSFLEALTSLQSTSSEPDEQQNKSTRAA